MVTERGMLELMLEILRLACRDRVGITENGMVDPIMAMDVMWAMRDNSLFQRCMQELQSGEEPDENEESEVANEPRDFQQEFNKIMIPIRKMNIGDLTKECNARKVSLTGVKMKKDVLIGLLRKQVEEDLRNEPEVSTPEPAPAPAPVTLSPEAVMVQAYLDVIFKIENYMLNLPDITATQMTEMSHLLPPLSPFYQVWKLDEWQKRALRYIDDNESVLICAPTSSGKTVISSYVASMYLRENNSVAAGAARAGADESSDDDDDNLDVSDSRVLFVVPTEPLVWQVAAHFAKFLKVDTKVALVTEQMSFTPATAQIVVGTPAALESAMTKVHKTVREYHNMHDGSALTPGFTRFKWAVYDEVHSLNAETADGAALQRLIRMVNCPSLHLSATVGNAEKLRSWLATVRSDHRNIPIVEAPPEEGWEQEAFASGGQEAINQAENNRLVKKIQHEGRFINIQRHVWASSESCPRGDHLELLSPLSAISTNFLQENGFTKCRLPMTPLDAYNTWKKIEEFFPLEEVQELEPRVFFAYKFDVSFC